MKAFLPPTAIRAKLTKTTPHKENHGPDLVQAVSLRIRWDTTNESLALLHPNLKDMLFWREPSTEAQEQLDGMQTITPNLRVPIAELPLKIDGQWTGYTASIEHGIDDDSALELYVCKLSKFTVDAKEGGTAVIEWSLHSNKEITPELIGALCGREGTEIVVTLTPPAIDTTPTIDGSKEAFERDHPSAGGDDADHDATDLFVGQHAGNFGSPEGGDDTDGDNDDDDDGADHVDQAEVPTSRRIAPKYRDPMTGQTWTGRGLKPKWLTVALQSGKALEDFAL